MSNVQASIVSRSAARSDHTKNALKNIIRAQVPPPISNIKLVRRNSHRIIPRRPARNINQPGNKRVPVRINQRDNSSVTVSSLGKGIAHLKLRRRIRIIKVNKAVNSINIIVIRKHSHIINTLRNLNNRNSTTHNNSSLANRAGNRRKRRKLSRLTPKEEGYKQQSYQQRIPFQSHHHFLKSN